MILCEYSHAMGNSNGSLADYWAAFETLSRPAGRLHLGMDRPRHPADDADGRTYWAYGGDFGDAPNDANFVTDGIVWPDRTPHPALYEFKYLVQPVRVEPVDLAAGRVRIVNKQDFISLDWLRGEWTLTVEGVAVQSGALPPLDIATGRRAGCDPRSAGAGQRRRALPRLPLLSADSHPLGACGP